MSHYPAYQISSAKASVATPNSAYQAMRADWELCHDLMGGTAAMRAAGEKWLPREPGESRESYQNRLNRSVLYNGFGRTIQTLVGKLFRTPIIMDEDMPTPLKKMAEDVDLTGRSLTVFTRDIFQAAIMDGLTHILIDYHQTEALETREQEKQYGYRPYFVHIPAQNLLSFRTEMVSGREKLVEVRIKEIIYEADGQWGEKRIEQIRILEPFSYKLYRYHGRRGWQIHEQGETSMAEIPLVTIYTQRTGYMQARPPLLDLAWLNVAHWQSSSDQRHILHVARVPILFGKSLNLGDDRLEIGPNRMITGEGAQADLKYVEHSGAAIEAGRQDIQDLEDRMTRLGTDLLMRPTGSTTATARALDAVRQDTALAGMIRSLEDGLQQAFRWAGSWLGLEEESSVRISMNEDLGLPLNDTDQSRLLFDLYKDNIIRRETLLRELNRRGILSPDHHLEHDLRPADTTANQQPYHKAADLQAEQEKSFADISG